MEKKEVVEVIHEALVMYIDDISMIGDVSVLPASEQLCCSEKLIVTLRDGERYKLILQKCAS
jgi:hypothetical protein